ncbi:MAG: hypothetical protein AABY14_03765, partial [Nanoarchaeota archaeon]
TGKTFECISFASYDYLGLSDHPKLKEAGIKAIETMGLSTGGSMILSGKTSIHEELEERVARFLRKEDVIYGQAKRLLESAYNFMIKSQNKKLSSSKNIQEWYELNEKIQFSDIHFPPCIKLILNGLHDGRKRALFILLNFFSSLNLGHDDIKKILKEWNKKNDPPLPENYMDSQLTYHAHNKKRILPPNCNNNAYYLDIGVCKPDNLCSKIKNPVSYVIRKIKK